MTARWAGRGLLIVLALAAAAWLTTATSSDGLAALCTILTTQRALLVHTLWYGVGVSVAATALGWALAHLQHRYAVPGGGVLHLLFLAPLLVPSFTFAIGLLILLGHNGMITRFLPRTDVYGPIGLIVAGTLCRLPYAYLPLAWGYRRLDPHQLDAAAALGVRPGAAFYRVALPRLLPILASTALIILADAITDVANPLVIGGGFSTVAQRLFEAVNGEGDSAAAAAYALLLAVPALLLWAAALRFTGGRPTRPVPRATPPSRRPIGWAWSLIAISWSVGAAVAGLLAVVVAGSVATGAERAGLTLDHFTDLLTGPAARPLATTLLVAVVSVPAVAIIAFRLTTAAAAGGRIETTRRLLTAASALPPAALGVAGLFALNAAAAGFASINLPVQAATWSAFAVIVAVHIFRFVPVVALPALRTVRSLVPAVRDSALSLGARQTDLARSVYWPRVRPEVIGGGLTTWARTLTAVSSVILLTNAQVPLLTVRMLTDVDAGRLAPACAAAVVLAGLVGLAAAAQWLVAGARTRDRRIAVAVTR